MYVYSSIKLADICIDSFMQLSHLLLEFAFFVAKRDIIQSTFTK